MSKRLSDEERIEQYFTREPQSKCLTQREHIDLVMRVRFPDLAPAKRGRRAKAKAKPRPSEACAEAERA